MYIVDFWKEILRTYEQTRLPILPEIYDVLSKCEGAIEPWEFKPGMVLCYVAAPDGVSIELIQVND